MFIQMTDTRTWQTHVHSYVLQVFRGKSRRFYYEHDHKRYICGEFHMDSFTFCLFFISEKKYKD